MMEGVGNWITSKRIFEVEVSFPLKMLTSFYLNDFWSFFCSVS
jgi:hypothetical protein